MLQLCRVHSHSKATSLIQHVKHLRWRGKERIALNQNFMCKVRRASWKCLPVQPCAKANTHLNHLKSLKAKQSLFLLCRGMSSDSSSSSSKNHYEVLGLEKNASSKDIRAAFLRRSKECHPDLNRSGTVNHQQFVQVNEAYSVLSRPQARRRYDTSLDLSQALRETDPPQYSDFYRHPRETSAEDWLKQSGLKEEYFTSRVHQQNAGSRARKVSNSHIVASCLLFMLTGIVFHIVAVKRSSEKHIQSLNDRDLRTHELWMKAKKDAQKFTPQELSQQLLDRQEREKAKRAE
ncbi:hypothetical protein EGW08_021443 [Elysia chlorotica]|uniref:J domain-containing protein n=1 Tax=Elysia chlorotica TaxID=188477 RepID=A0A3S1AXE7_ELYCH|nr:hypothetical protein EGW08_021443 [Elysia chlorotica]